MASQGLDAAQAYYTLAPGVKVTAEGDAWTIAGPGGKTISVPAPLARIDLPYVQLPRSLEMLRKRADALADPAYWQPYLDAGILVRAADVSDTFRGDAWHAQLERPGSDQLVFQFRGGMYDVIGGVPPPAFAERTGLTAHNLVFFRDNTHTFYEQGVSPQLPTIDHVMAWQEGYCAARPGLRGIHCLGVSMGGGPALLSGHRLRADTVWAFSPAPGSDAMARRLREALSIPNGKTVYRIWYGAQSALDREFAGSLRACPGVQLHPVQTESHLVTQVLWERGELPRLLAVSANGAAAAGDAAIAPANPAPPPIAIAPPRAESHASAAPALEAITVEAITVDAIATIIRHVLGDGSPDTDIDAALGDMHSFEMVQLIAALEQRWPVHIDLGLLADRDLMTGASVTAMVRDFATGVRKRPGAARSAR